MSLYETIQSDIKVAMKAKEALTVSTLRLLSSALQYAFIDKANNEYSDEDVINAIQKQIKQRNDSIDNYKNAGRIELQEKEENEVLILKKYLPEQLSDEALTTIIKTIIEESGITSKKEMGKVMKPIMAKTAGKADGKKISQIVLSLLS